MVSIAEYRLKKWWTSFFEGEEYRVEKKEDQEINPFDYLIYLQRMEKAGIIVEWIRNQPGYSLEPTPRQIKEGAKFVKKYKRILELMSENDIKRLDLISDSKREYMARKSGATLEEVYLLLDRFEDLRMYARLLRSVN